jgi:hypothetical protein
MDNKVQSVGFSLRQITTEQFAIVEESFSEGKEVELSLNLRFGANLPDNKLIGAFVLFKFAIANQPFLLLEVGCQFEIEPTIWESLYDAETNSIEFGKGFMAHLAMLAVGTARGVMHAKTENTIFNQFIIPTINVSELIKEDIKL